MATRRHSEQPQSAPTEQPSPPQSNTSSCQPQTNAVSIKVTNTKSPVTETYVNNVPSERKRKICPSEMNYLHEDHIEQPRRFEHAQLNHTAYNDVTRLTKSKRKANDLGRVLIKQEQEVPDQHCINEHKNQELFDSSEINLWRCGQCCKSFAQRAMLQIHVCPRSPNKPYKCGHCSEAFAFSNELRTHVVTHTNEKPFKCGYCSRSFAGATTLNNHIRTHTGEKPFMCDKCGRNFTQASQLSRHQRIPSECY